MGLLWVAMWLLCGCYGVAMGFWEWPGDKASCLFYPTDLFEGVLGEESEELEDWKVWVELHPLQMRGNKPVEEITALCKKSEEGGKGEIGGEGEGGER